MGTIVAKQKPTVKITTFADGGGSVEQKRAKILKKRLDLLNAYLVSEDETREGKSFVKFLNEKKITLNDFIEGLPKQLQQPPASGIDKVMAYATLMNKHFFNQYVTDPSTKTEMGLNADGFSATGGALSEYTPDELKAYINEHLMYAAENRGLFGKPVNVLGEMEELRRVDQARQLIVSKAGTSDYDMPTISQYGITSQEASALNNTGFIKDKVLMFKNALQLWSSVKCPTGYIYNPDTKTCDVFVSPTTEKTAWQKLKDMIKKEGGGNQALHLFNLSNPLMVLARNSYLTLVKLNVFGLATTLAKMKQNPDKSYYESVFTRWYNLGGTASYIDSAISQGQNKKVLLRGNNFQMTGAEVSAAIVSASAIIAALGPIVLQFKKDKGLPIDPDESNPPSGGGTPPPPSEESGLMAFIKDNVGLTIGIALGVAFVITTVVVISVNSKGK